MSRRFLIILAAFVILFGGLLIFNKKDSGGDNGGNNSNSNSTTLSENKTAEGSTGVTLIEYGDFQCPACYQFYPVVKELKRQYASQVTFQFRHFPLTEIHKNALISAKAAQAAAKQNKFWEMHDKLYEGQPNWESSQNPSQIFEDYATQIGLNMDQFRNDSKSEEINDIVMADRNHAKSQGYSSTPTFVLDGKKIEPNPTTLEEFKKLIDDAIKAKQNA